MTKRKQLGEWSNGIQAFWYGANADEWIAWKGSNQIFVYSSESYPSPPYQVIQHDKRIETLEDFNDAFENGKKLDVFYNG